MEWVALAIIIAGYLIAQAVNRAKQKELEANPEYRKKVVLERYLKMYQEDLNRYRKLTSESYQKQEDAEKKDDEKDATYWKGLTAEYLQKRDEATEKVEEYTNLLSYGVSMSKTSQSVFKYNFEIEKVFLGIRNVADSSQANLYFKKGKVDASYKEFKELKGLPISVIVETPKELNHDGVWIAQNRADDKASEIVATLLGTTFGGNQQHREASSYDLIGKFVHCKLVSIEQIS